jgi:hypothetical protein
MDTTETPEMKRGKAPPRYPVNMRMSGPLRDQLEAASAASGRSMTQEAY